MRRTSGRVKSLASGAPGGREGQNVGARRLPRPRPIDWSLEVILKPRDRIPSVVNGRARLSLRAELVRAIAEHRVVELRYDDDLADRRVQPHILYRTSAGHERVDIYQVEGPTHSGALPEWRQFDPGRIRRLDVLDETFTPAPGYNPGGDRYRHGVIARA
jgi:hypothetical protein